MFETLDRFIDFTLMREYTPLRFVMTSARMAALVDGGLPFSRVRLCGQSGEVLDNFRGELTRDVLANLADEVRRRGISHYRGIPIEVDDSQTGLQLISRPWGEP